MHQPTTHYRNALSEEITRFAGGGIDLLLLIGYEVLTAYRKSGQHRPLIEFVALLAK
jgi:hypothetical protein